MAGGAQGSQSVSRGSSQSTTFRGVRRRDRLILEASRDPPLFHGLRPNSNREGSLSPVAAPSAPRPLQQKLEGFCVQEIGDLALQLPRQPLSPILVASEDGEAQVGARVRAGV